MNKLYKECPKCGAGMTNLYGEEAKRKCTNGKCGYEIEWKLNEGQKNLIGNNRSK